MIRLKTHTAGHADPAASVRPNADTSGFVRLSFSRSCLPLGLPPFKPVLEKLSSNHARKSN